MKGLGPAEWSTLSLLYDEAMSLPRAEADMLLARLRAQRHPLLGSLLGMLDAARQVQTQDFLEAPPRLPAGSAPGAGWSPGALVGPYRLESLLGSGGMAEVWRARRDDGSLRREIALKLPHVQALGGAARAVWARRFERERDILAALRHPHIAALLDAGVTPAGQAWLALEYVRGESLMTYCDARSLPIRERVALFRQVLLAVQHAHAHLVIHRDLKPSNILVTAEGEVRLLDFGIAKLIEAEAVQVDATELTRQAGHYLTPAYASPEQLLGRALGTRSDVYALGVLFYELLTGVRPYEPRLGTPAALERSILEHDPRAPSRREPDEALLAARATSLKAWRRTLAPELDAVALRALAKSPEARYSSVDALIADIDRWLGGEPVLARPPSAGLRLRKFVGRHRLAVGLGAAAVASLLMLTSIAVLQSLRAREESARAIASRDFLLDIFRRADPSESKGKELTSRELLGWGRDRALATLGNQPSLQADVLQDIGRIQLYQDDYAGAELSLAQASALYERLGRGRERVLAEVDRAEVAWRMGNYADIEGHLKAAERGLPVPAPDDLIARLAEMRGTYASAIGDAAGARQHYALALERARAAWGSRHPRTVDMLRGLAEVELNDVRYVEAMQHLDEAAAMAAEVPGMDPIDLFGLAAERATAQRIAGRFAAVASALVDVEPKCRAALGPRHETCALIRRIRAVAYLRLGDTASAEALLPEILAQTESQGSPKREAEALVIACRILGQSGRPDTPAPLWRNLEALAQGRTPLAGDAEMVHRALQARAEAWLRAGRPDDAQPWLDRDRALLEATPQFGRNRRAELEVLMGQAMAQRGRWAEALDWLQRADADTAAAYGPGHAQAHLFRLNQIRPLRNLGQQARADAIVLEAQPVLNEAFGEASSLRRRLVPGLMPASTELFY